MKNIIRLGSLVAIAIYFASCSLDKTPISDFSEVTVGGKDSTGSTVKFKTRAEMKTQYDALYNQLKGSESIERWALDYYIYTDTHADNSYRGAIDTELSQLEQQKQDGINKNIERDWGSLYKIISIANSVICNVDSVPDATLTAQERKQWKAEALILRAMVYFDMVRLWGDVPLVITEPPAITAANIKEVYPLYYPKRDSSSIVYRQIVSDLNAAVVDAPNNNPANKFLLSKTVAYGMLVRIYAEKPIQNYAKVIEYASEVEKSSSLVANYGDLFDMNATNTDLKYRNTTESIFEIPFSGGGNWLTWMYGVDASDPASKYDWAKWLTPSRDLIAAFDKAGDVVRKNQTIKYAVVTWSNHYPASNYPHMYKFRSKFHSIIKMRLADILLLKAEAYVGLGDLESAASVVNQIRARAKLPALDSKITTSKDAMVDAVLNERRLELAFEGQRWFDLVRSGKVFSVMNTLNSRDPGRMPMDYVNQNMTLLPLPQSQIDINPSMIQNPGY